MKIDNRNPNNIQIIDNEDFTSEFYDGLPIINNFEQAKFKYEGKEIILQGTITKIFPCDHSLYLGKEPFGTIILFPLGFLNCDNNNGIDLNLNNIITVKGKVYFSEEFENLIFLINAELLD